MIRVGQILEAQVAFCAVPISKGKYLMICKLRALCILSRQVQKVCAESTNKVCADEVAGRRRQRYQQLAIEAAVPYEESQEISWVSSSGGRHCSPGDEAVTYCRR